MTIPFPVLSPGRVASNFAFPQRSTFPIVCCCPKLTAYTFPSESLAGPSIPSVKTPSAVKGLATYNSPRKSACSISKPRCDFSCATTWKLNSQTDVTAPIAKRSVAIHLLIDRLLHLHPTKRFNGNCLETHGIAQFSQLIEHPLHTISQLTHQRILFAFWPPLRRHFNRFIDPNDDFHRSVNSRPIR